MINTGHPVHKIKVSKTNATEIKVDTNYLQSFIGKLGNDSLAQPGKFLFIPEPNVLEVFIYLYEIVKKNSQGWTCGQGRTHTWTKTSFRISLQHLVQIRT